MEVDNFLNSKMPYQKEHARFLFDKDRWNGGSRQLDIYLPNITRFCCIEPFHFDRPETLAVKCICPRLGRPPDDDDGVVAIGHGASHDRVRHPVLAQRRLGEPFVLLGVITVDVPANI